MIGEKSYSSPPATRSGFFFSLLFLANRVLTVRLTSTGNPVPGNQEFCLAPSETMVEQVNKIRSLT
jgi:hypothetical protein